MLLRYIKLNNFRQYKGEQVIEFSCNPERNVTIILGDNTSGKTTLVQAFNWCLYSKAGFKTQRLLNKDVEDDMNAGEKESVYVEIGLTHKGIDYTVSRRQDYQCTSVGNVQPLGVHPKMSYLQADGQTKTIDGFEIPNSINLILPEGLSNYFFFDGERINNISNKQDVAESVKGLMGLDVLDEARSHLKGAMSVFTKSLNIAGNEQAIQAKSNMESQETKLKNIMDDLDNIEKEIVYYQAQRDEATIALRENQKTADKQREKEQLDAVIKGLEKDLVASVVDPDQKRAASGIVDKFNSNAFAFFGKPLIKEAIEMVKSSTSVSESIKGMNSKAIDQILERGICVCGTKVLPGSDEEKSLLRERDYMPPKSIGTLVGEFTEVSKVYLTMSDGYHSDVTAKFSDFRKTKRELARKMAERDRVSEDLINQVDTKHLEQEHIRITRTLRDKEKEKDKLIASKGICEDAIKRYQKAFDNFVKTNEKNAHINECIQYAKELFDWVNDSYTSREESIRERLELKVNAIFGRMYHGKRTVKIDKSYKVVYSDIKTDESGGLETVKNFAFISGLVDLAREKINAQEKDDYNLEPESYPLVMDAPFSKADEKHVSSISKVLPEIAEQVIMVVMEKDWTFAQTEMEDRVGNKYRLVKGSETLTTIKTL